LRNSFESLWAQIEKFFQRGSEYAVSRGYQSEGFGKRELVANEEWLGSLGLVEFLSTVGRHVRVGQMLARESVKARMESAQGINYAEFTYQLLQSYDFWWLNKNKGCRLQVELLSITPKGDRLTSDRSAETTSTEISRQASISSPDCARVAAKNPRTRLIPPMD
jgi:hypothetical protein